MIIRLILVACVGGFAFALIRSSGVRGRAWALILLAVLSALGVLAILVPEWTTLAANAVGVGRGADLLIYLLITTLAFVILMMYTRIRLLQGQVTRLARAISIQGVSLPGRTLSDEVGNQDEVG